MAHRASKLAVGIVSLLMPLSLVAGAQAQSPTTSEAAAAALGPGEGAAFAMTNATRNNQIVSYRRAADGSLTRVGSVSTRGAGIGVDLDAQSPLELSTDHRYLYAVNAGTDEVSVFAVDGTNLTFVQKVYAGDEPVSLTIHENLLYVLNGSVAGNGITGFTRAADGTLTQLPDSFRLLSSPIAVPGEVQFSPDGRLLVVTEKTTNTLLTPANALDVFQVNAAGVPSATPRRNASTGLRPFSMAFRNNNQLLVTESFNAAESQAAVSSYLVSRAGAFVPVSRSVPNQQTDTCWIVITDDGRYAFTANFGSGTISSYRIDAAGRIQLVEGNAAFTGTDSQPVDLALSADSHYLYLLLRGTGAVASFEIGSDGSLTSLGIVTGGLPVADGASGLAVY
ncbi:MAG: beta-propeller fold lactonase family protein [Geodermatophilaceae bacterium]|nr:beta-propeller fold lactonase family protein [Geodermatophilaceae bacterium]